MLMDENKLRKQGMVQVMQTLSWKNYFVQNICDYNPYMVSDEYRQSPAHYVGL